MYYIYRRVVDKYRLVRAKDQSYHVRAWTAGTSILELHYARDEPMRNPHWRHAQRSKAYVALGKSCSALRNIGLDYLTWLLQVWQGDIQSLALYDTAASHYGCNSARYVGSLTPSVPCGPFSAIYSPNLSPLISNHCLVDANPVQLHTLC